MDKSGLQRLHSGMLRAVDVDLWHRVQLSGPQETPTMAAVEYLALVADDAGRCDVVFVPLAAVFPRAPSELAREVQGLSIDPGGTYRYDWALQDMSGQMVGMPDQDMIEAGAQAYTRHKTLPLYQQM